MGIPDKIIATVNMQNLHKFTELLNLFTAFLKDTRVPVEVKEDFCTRLKEELCTKLK